MTEMKANSSQMWVLFGGAARIDVGMALCSPRLGQGIGPETLMIEDGAITLWLAAMYALMFGSESWLR